jgi:hypothetical protein
MMNRAVIAFIAFTVLWVLGVGVITRTSVPSEMRRLRGAAANVLHVIQSARL